MDTAEEVIKNVRKGIVGNGKASHVYNCFTDQQGTHDTVSLKAFAENGQAFFSSQLSRSAACVEEAASQYLVYWLPMSELLLPSKFPHRSHS